MSCPIEVVVTIEDIEIVLPDDQEVVLDNLAVDVEIRCFTTL